MASPTTSAVKDYNQQPKDYFKSLTTSDNIHSYIKELATRLSSGQEANKTGNLRKELMNLTMLFIENNKSNQEIKPTKRELTSEQIKAKEVCKEFFNSLSKNQDLPPLISEIAKNYESLKKTELANELMNLSSSYLELNAKHSKVIQEQKVPQIPVEAPKKASPQVSEIPQIIATQIDNQIPQIATSPQIVEQKPFDPQKLPKEKQLVSDLKKIFVEIEAFYNQLDKITKSSLKNIQTMSASTLSQESINQESQYQQYSILINRLDAKIRVVINSNEELKKEIENTTNNSKDPQHYLRLKGTYDNLTYYATFAQIKIAAISWKLEQINLISNVLPQINQLAIDIDKLYLDINSKKAICKQTSVVSNDLNSRTIPNYSELCKQTLTYLPDYTSIKEKVENSDPSVKHKTAMADIDLHDIQTKTWLSTQILSTYTTIQEEQKAVFDLMQTPWSKIALGMGGNETMPSLLSRSWYSTQKPLAYEINKLKQTVEKFNGNLPSDSTEGTTWKLEKFVFSPFDKSEHADKKQSEQKGSSLLDFTFKNYTGQ